MYRSSTSYVTGRTQLPPVPSAVKWLLIANFSIFALHHLVVPYVLQPLGFYPEAVVETLFLWFGFLPAKAVGTLWLWQFVTYLFIHGGFGHILGNMFVLWMIGGELERTWGWQAFLRYYFVTGIGAACFQVPMAWGDVSAGASGSVYGLLIAFAVLFPNRLLYVYFLFPVRARTLVIVLFIVEIWLALSNPRSPIAHLAHVGGAVVGWIYLKRAWRFRTWRLGAFFRDLRWRWRRRRFSVRDGGHHTDRERGGRDDWIH